MCCFRVAVVGVCFLLQSFAFGQHRPHSTTGTPPASSPGTSPDAAIETLTRAVAIQARPDQVEFFHSTIDSVDSALEQSRELQGLGPAINSIPTVNAKSLQLRDTLDDVDHDSRHFLTTFSKRQETELKTLTKRLRKSYSYVEKEYRVVEKWMEPENVSADRLAGAAANLEKALSDFRTDEIRLGREMGIQSK